MITLGGVVYVVWDDNTPGNFDIFFRFSTNGGTTWNPDLTLPARNISNNLGASQFAKLAIDNTQVNVAWCDNTPGHTQILYSSSQNGTNFSVPLNVSNDLPNSAAAPHIGVSSTGSIFVVWKDYSSGLPQIFFSCSTNHGVTFSTVQNISKTPGSTGGPALAVDPFDTIYVVWHDNSTQDGNNDIFFTHSL